MKAAYINRLGGPENIIYGDLPEPELSANQYRIKVTAVDINPVDILIRNGTVPTKMRFPHILGRDLAGIITEAGVNAKQFKVGDRVWAIGQGWDGRPGTFSEVAVVSESWLNPIPDNVRDEEIAAVSLVGMTAQVGLVVKARLKAGEIIFVNGGSGGVGASAVQIAKILGAQVITTAGSEEKVMKLRDLGADLVINYKTEEVAKAVKQWAPDGVNVWWESTREPDFDMIVSLLTMQGRMVVIAGQEARPSFPVGPFYSKSCSLHGFITVNSPAEELHAAAHDINQWMASGKLKARIDRILPLSRTAEAHRMQEDSTIKKTGILAGKIVLKP